MQLSEAIRLGAMMKPQGFGKTFRNGKSCAMGAAYDAIGITEADFYKRFTASHKALRDAFPILADTSTVYSCSCGRIRPLGSMIQHLNDEHCWTREQIADWIATKEPQPEPQAAETTELATVAQ